MKRHSYATAALAALLSVAGLSSCTQDWGLDNEGEGVLKMRLVLDSDVTRAELDQDALANSAIIYISNSKGLIRRYEGRGEMPEGGIVLKSGAYVAEAWVGDSVPASFDTAHKYYKGYEPFQITTGTTNIAMVCRIANVVASVNSASIDPELMKDWKITVGHSRGSLEFTADNVNEAVGYYMMPSTDTALTWTVEGKDLKNEAFSKTGTIENVQGAHHYILNLKYGDASDPSQVGGAFITITVDDTEILHEDEVVIHSAPKINGYGFDLQQGVSSKAGSFGDVVVTTAAYGTFKNMILEFSNPTAFGLDRSDYDLMLMADSYKDMLNNAGIIWTANTEDDHTSGYITFQDKLLNQLSDGKYTIGITLVSADPDSDRERTTQAELVVNVSDDAVRLPDNDADVTVRSYSLTLPVTQVKEDATNMGVEYRPFGTSEWTFVAAEATRTTGWVVRLTGLTPATRYEFRAVSEGFVSTTIKSYTTESVFLIPNSSFEEWSVTSEIVSNKDVPFPGSGSTRTYWDTGNHGSMTMNKAITNKSDEIKNSGSYSAKLQSQFVGLGTIGKYAAGNIFVGTYDGTDGTDGILTFGRPFDGSHPVKLVGYAHYRPGVIENKTGTLKTELVGQTDTGNIYVALMTEPFQVKTKNQSQLFDSNAATIIGYGEVNWQENIGPDGGMVRFEIPIEYRDSRTPTYMAIVCSASKYGDYFTCGPSVMYLDDFELVYE